MLPSKNTEPAPRACGYPQRKFDVGRFLARVALALWMPTVALGIGSLMVGHWAPLPTPDSSEGSSLETALASLVEEGAVPSNGPWKIVHVLLQDCGCSGRVLDYLVDDSRRSAADEWVLLVGTTENVELQSALEEAGFRPRAISPEDLAIRYGMESAPLFVVLDPQGRLRFLGGYTARKQSLAYVDLATLEALQSGSTPVSHPVFGCGVSSALQAALDPLGLKY